ncbi:MAG: hypothetical protein NZ822_01360, partial [Patescibacteria group bacterium]|nr:hypothetical protein [Patescibacteria group bacterium]
MPYATNLKRFPFFKSRVLKIDYKNNRVIELSLDSTYQQIAKNFEKVFSKEGVEIFTIPTLIYSHSFHRLYDVDERYLCKANTPFYFVF